MNKNLKIGLIVLSVIGVSAGAYFAIKFYNLRQAYKKSLTPDDVIKIIDQKSKDLGTEMEEDPDLKRISSSLTESNVNPNSNIKNPYSSDYE